MKTFSSLLRTIKTKTVHTFPGPIRSAIAASFAKGKEFSANTPEEKAKYKKMTKRFLEKEPPKFSFSEGKAPWNPDVDITDWTTPKGVRTATIHNPSTKRELQNFASAKIPKLPNEPYPESKGWLHGDQASFTEPQHPHDQWKEHSVAKGSDDGVPIYISHKQDGTAHVEISPGVKNTSWHKASREDLVNHVQNHPLLNKVYGRDFSVSVHDDGHHNIKEQVSDDDIKKFKTHHALNPEHIAGALEQAHENLKQANTPGEKEFHQKMINNLSGALEKLKNKLH